MKNKSWIIILIMGIALTISILYSVAISQENSNSKESTVTTKSIIEMRATTVTIKNTLTGKGEVEYKERTLEQNNTIENKEDENVSNDNQPQDVVKTYQISLSIEDKDLDKAKIGQNTQISIEKDEETLNYVGKVIDIKKESNNKSTLNIEISNPDEKVEEKMIATCGVIIEEAKDVVGLPIEAIQKNDLNEEFVDVVQYDGTTKQVLINTGISDDYYVEITSGLKVGDRVQIVKSSTTVVNKDNSETIEK